MALVKDKPAELKPQNDLDKIPDDLLSAPPAYYSFGSTPAPMESPVSLGDTETFMVRVRCKGEKRSERTDGELRHVREFEIQACWKPGERPPTADDDNQPPLFGTDGEAEPEALGDILGGRPAFSNLTSGDE